MSSDAPARGRRHERLVLEFLAPGAPNEDLPMQLEVVTRLPDSTRAWLEAPLRMVDVMRERSPFANIDEKRGVARLPLPATGRRLLGEAIFPADSQSRLRLVIEGGGPEWRRSDHEIFVRQLWKGDEVGRVTWRVAATAPPPTPGKKRRGRRRRA